MGLEGIVSKRMGSIYRSGRSPDWLKFKNPEGPAVRREAEEDLGQAMTILTLRRIREDRFEVTGPDIEPVTFKTRVEARDWCLTHYQGSPIREVGGRKRVTPTAVVTTAELAEILERRPDLKGKRIETVSRILHREARLALRLVRTSKNAKMNPVALAAAGAGARLRTARRLQGLQEVRPAQEPRELGQLPARPRCWS